MFLKRPVHLETMNIGLRGGNSGEEIQGQMNGQVNEDSPMVGTVSVAMAWSPHVMINIF